MKSIWNIKPDGKQNAISSNAEFRSPLSKSAELLSTSRLEISSMFGCAEFNTPFSTKGAIGNSLKSRHSPSRSSERRFDKHLKRFDDLTNQENQSNNCDNNLNSDCNLNHSNHLNRFDKRLSCSNKCDSNKCHSNESCHPCDSRQSSHSSSSDKHPIDHRNLKHLNKHLDEHLRNASSNHEIATRLSESLTSQSTEHLAEHSTKHPAKESTEHLKSPNKAHQSISHDHSHNHSHNRPSQPHLLKQSCSSHLRFTRTLFTAHHLIFVLCFVFVSFFSILYKVEQLGRFDF